MKWTVEFADDARREFLALQDPDRYRIGERIRLLEGDAFPQGCRKLRNYENLYRIRVGRYRVVYYLVHRERRVLITRVRHRKDAYRGL